MGRRSTPERLYEARRAGLVARLTRGGRMGEERAEALIVAWEAEAAQRGLERLSVAYWRDVETWLEERVPR